MTKLFGVRKKNLYQALRAKMPSDVHFSRKDNDWLTIVALFWNDSPDNWSLNFAFDRAVQFVNSKNIPHYLQDPYKLLREANILAEDDRGVNHKKNVKKTKRTPKRKKRKTDV